MYVNRKEKTPQYNVFKLNTTLTNFPQCQLKKKNNHQHYILCDGRIYGRVS